MKKLLYTLLAVSIIFSACEKEDESSSNNNSNNYNGNNSSLAIGDTHQGGIIFYLDGNGGGLIAAPYDQGTFEWGCYQSLVTGADGTTIGTGFQNTIDIVNANCSPNQNPNNLLAANVCANLTLGGYSDWFLPSIDELYEMYITLHVQGLGNFTNFLAYWSSTELDSDNAWYCTFANNGLLGNSSKFNETFNVRAIKAF